MSYSKNLGNVKGKTGAVVKPSDVIRDDSDPSKTIIKWGLVDSGNTEKVSDSIIQTVYFIPYIDTDEPYILKWRANIDGVAPIDSVPLPRGQPGIPGVNIETIPIYYDDNNNVLNDLDRIRYHYNGEYGLKKNYEVLEEGTIFLILNNKDPNDITKIAPIAYVYDKQRDSYGEDEKEYAEKTDDDTPNYNDNAFIVIEHPIDLTNYYSKDQTYSKEEIDNMFGQISTIQDRIINILDNGLTDFYIDPDDNLEEEENETNIDFSIEVDIDTTQEEIDESEDENIGD